MTRYFTVPYDSGHRNVRMGAGPLRLVQLLGIDAQEIAPKSEWRAEIRTTFELYRALAERVAASTDFPVVLGGNCGVAIGTAAGIGTDDLAVLWFDAHGDYNTPDRTESGFLDGMSMAILTGRCWQNLASTIPNFKPLPPSRAMHVGGRDFSPGEREAMLQDGIAERLEELDARRLHVHIDLDVLDPRYGRANPYAVDGGLSPDDVLAIVGEASKRMQLAALSIASYDPAADERGTIGEIGARIVRAVAPR
jgi:arginase